MRIWITSALIFSIFVNTVPAQTSGKTPEKNVADSISLTRDPIEAYRALTRNPIFDTWLARMTSDQNMAKTLEVQRDELRAFFQNRVKDDFQTVVQKAREFNKNRQDKSPLNGRSIPQSPAVVQPQSRFAANFSFINASYLAKPADSPEIIVTETETSRGSKATDVKTIENETSIVTQTAGVENNVSFEDNTMSQERNTTKIIDVASKTDRSKASDETKQGGRISFGVCPDAAGIVRGTARYRMYNQQTINTGKQLAVLTMEYVMEYQITAHVDDSATLTDFDLVGTITEKILGFDRAYRLGLAENESGVTDGTRSISYTVKGSTPPASMASDAKIGKVSLRTTGISNTGDLKRLSPAHDILFSLMMLDLTPIMLSSVSRWRNYECVEVKCVSAKNALKPNESTEVDTVSVSKLDGGQFSANLTGSGTQSVSPGNGIGKPNLIFTLTAPKKGVARIVVDSISRRGIGLEVLEIPVEERKKPKPPVETPKPKDCDAGWTGTVKAVNTRREDRQDAPSGRLVRSVYSKNQTYDIEIDVLGTRDLSGGIVNNFIGMARAGYLESDYRERTYASGRMSCSTGIIESGEVQKYDARTKGDTTARLLVAISVIGRNGIISFSPPEVVAEVIAVRTYESNCPSYNAANSSTERDRNPRTIPGPYFEVEFDVDPRTPNQIKGTKTVENSDGTETTYSWDLTRCK